MMERDKTATQRPKIDLTQPIVLSVQACPTDISCHERDEIRASKGGRTLLFTLDPMPGWIVQLIVISFLIDIAAGMLYKESVKCGCLYISNVRTRSLPRMVERYASLRGDATERKAPKKVRPTRGWESNYASSLTSVVLAGYCTGGYCRWWPCRPGNCSSPSQAVTR